MYFLKQIQKFIFIEVITIICVLILLPEKGNSQYFGRNKVRYDDFDFKVMEAGKFHIYYYPQESEAIEDAAKMLERWDTRISTVLNHTLPKYQPVIIYANHADFQQTSVIQGLISQGTGGVTEGLKKRVVLPLTGIYKDNDHVLGHELVHAFQYDIMKSRERKGAGARQMPLWFIEGMAEYLSIGRTDALTAMWLRDAVLHDDVPSIEDVSSNQKYFPYRYGHAIWSYIGAKWGDHTVGALLKGVLANDWKSGFKKTLNMSQEDLSKEWTKAVKETYQHQIQNKTKPEDVGKKLVAGEYGMNLSPSVSPDGKYVAFLSRQEIFSLDLYLADAASGKILKKLVSSNTDAHFDALRFMNSSGTWSPDGQQFAFVVFKDGDNEMAVLDVNSREIQRTIKIAGVNAMTSLAWSPDGRNIAVSGLDGGISDLYLYDFETNSTSQLTEDKYAQIQPAWSPDGRYLAYVTDQGPETNFNELQYGPMKIALLNMNDQSRQFISIKGATKHIDPRFSPDGSNLYFIADPDGFSDLYRYSFNEGKFYRVTNVATGISGLTELSPAFSMSRHSGRMVFTVFEKTKYNLYSLEENQAAGTDISPLMLIEKPRMPLPDDASMSEGEIAAYIGTPARGLPQHLDFSTSDYDPTLQLLAIGQTGVGLVIDRYGTGLGGGVSMYFSDMLGYHSLSVAAQINGGLKDLGGQALYLNQQNRLHWGGVIGHIPYQTANLFSGIDTVNVNGQTVPARTLELIRQRVFIDRLSFLSEYPLTTNRRFEFSAGYTRISYDVESERITVVGNNIVDDTSEELDAPPGLNLFQSSVAYVGDYSFFGFTSPVNGKRFRIEVEPTFGSLRYLTALLDYRHYYFMEPVTFAFRLQHIGRYLKDSENSRLTPIFLGYETQVRGYDLGSFNISECSDPGSNSCPEIDRLIGSRMAIFNAEFRLPFFGTEQFGLINFPYLPTELVTFFDAGVAWTKKQPPKLKYKTDTAERVPVFSSGFAARVNLMGYLVAQFYYAFPFQRPEKTGEFGFVIAPGW